MSKWLVSKNPDFSLSLLRESNGIINSDLSYTCCQTNENEDGDDGDNGDDGNDGNDEDNQDQQGLQISGVADIDYLHFL